MKSHRILFFPGLLFILSLMGASVAAAPPSLVKEKQCDTCHRFSREEPEQAGPDLFFAGDKFQTEWLKQFLKQPETIRPAGSSHDPGFLKGQPEMKSPHLAVKTEEAGQLTDYLSTLKIMKESKPLSLESLSKGARVRVKILFERDFSCIACHQSYNLANQPRGGVSGPSLTNAGNRLRPEWVYQWLKNPEQFRPHSRMPLYTFDEETLHRLTQYIMSHTKNQGRP